jgi:hypothetical protein
MLSLAILFVTSLLLGMRHATDPDHIVAVSTIACRERSMWRASRIGVVWGLGHTLTIFVVGGAIIVFKIAFTPAIGLSLELTVALMLVVLGLLNLFNVRWGSAPSSSMRPFLVGVVHGLAGTAAVTLLILPLIDRVWSAVLYLVVFGAGTIAGMAIITCCLAAPAAYASSRVHGLQRWVRLASGAVSVTFGAYLGYQIAFVSGLLAGAPIWTPR